MVVVVAVGAARVGVVAVVRRIIASVRLIVATVVVRLVVTRLSRIVWCVVIGGLVVIAATRRFITVTGQVEDLDAVDLADKFLLESARSAIRASAGAENFLACARLAFAIGVEDDVAGARLGV